MSHFKILFVILALTVLSPLAAWAGPVNINTADAATLAEELTGIGESRAQAIVAYREKNGAFTSAEGLTGVKGVTARIIELNLANILVTSKQPE